MPPIPMRRTPVQVILLTCAVLLLLAMPRTATAGTYWWSGTPTAGANGFAWSNADQPWWNPWNTGRCESRGATIPAGNPCQLTWHVPAHLDARAGSISGTYKQSNPNFEQRNTVECNGTTTLQGTSTIQSFHREWPDMCSYLGITLLTPTAATTVSAASQFFDATSFSVELIDGNAPTTVLVDGHAGWKGAGGACIRYVFDELGSGLQSASLVNATTGQVLDAPSWSTTPITTGVGRVDRTPCMGAPGSGTFTLRASATDRSGNTTSHDVQASFDVTPPALGIPHGDGMAIADGRAFHGSAGEYRPAFTISASDAHSGLASMAVLVDGAQVATGTSWQPTADLAAGTHTIAFRATDAVGNVATVSRSFTIVDDVAPQLTIDSPGASGSSEPVLDVSAADDLTGLDTASWTVRVNGEVLVAASATRRLQADIGVLVDGTHQVEVSIADLAGNTATETITYAADSGDGLPNPPAEGGLHVLQAPSTVDEGTTYRVLAIGTRAGRPIPGRYELRDGAELVAAADAGVHGVVDLQATISSAGPLQLHAPGGSGLDPVTISYTFVPAPAPIDPCIAQPLDPACGGRTNGGSGGTSGGGAGSGGTPVGPTIITVNAAPAAGGGPAEPAAANANVAPGAPYPKDIVYYVNGVPHWNGLPLAESGAALDRVPPRWRMSMRAERAGMVKRTGRIALRLWTSEMSVLSIAPRGSARRVSVNPRRKLRTIHVRYDRRSPLGRRIARTRAGGVVVVRMRIVATDKNENSSRPRTLTFRVRV